VIAPADRARALALLMAVGLFNYIDRLCMSILSVPIRADLSLTDTQIGILTGLAFSLVYTLAAVPIARLADAGSRKTVIVVCLAVWSLMTAACGLATGFVMLAILRMGVAFGEAGCVPATQALLADYYPPHERARAIATWQLVFPIGTLLAFAGSGWLSDQFGWRITFALLGGAGLLLAPIVGFALREPPRGGEAAARAPLGRSAAPQTAPRDGARGEPFVTAFRSLWGIPSYRLLLLGGALIAYPLNATLYWNGQFYSRVFDMPVGDLALSLALLSGGAGAVGLYGGGWLADRLGRRDPRWVMRVPGIAGLAVGPLMLAQYFAPNAMVSLWLGVLPVILLNAFMPPQAAGAQSLVDPDRRALASGMIVLISGTFGTAVGPFATGLISDALHRGWGLGDDALRWAIGASALLAAGGGLLFLLAARHYAEDLRAAESTRRG
jgi:MFS family permease